MKSLKCRCGDDIPKTCNWCGGYPDNTYENLEKMYRNFYDSIYNYVSSNIKKKHLEAIYAHLGIKFKNISSVIRFCGKESIADTYEVAWIINKYNEGGVDYEK